MERLAVRGYNLAVTYVAPLPDHALATVGEVAEPTFSLAAVCTGNGLWLSLTGEVDQTERDRVVAALERRGTPAELVLEASGVTFLGSAGLSALIHAARRLQAIGRRVILLNPSPIVMEMLDICGIQEKFAIQRT